MTYYQELCILGLVSLGQNTYFCLCELFGAGAECLRKSWD